MSRRPFTLAGCAAALLALAAPAAAQPGMQPASPYHAEPPLPEVLPSPLPSLPPPAALAPAERPPGGLVGRTIRRPGFTARVAIDGSVQFSDSFGLFVDPIHGPLAGARFDLTDFLLRLWGEDPYASDKLALLESTREERAGLRSAHSREVMDRALADLPRYLDAIWSHSQWSPELRRRVLFALWDEAAEDGSPLVREGGARARAVIARFIASRLPPGAPDAYGAAELRALNRHRQSRQAFSPYRAPGDSPPGELGDPPTSVAAAARPARMLRF